MPSTLTFEEASKPETLSWDEAVEPVAHETPTESIKPETLSWEDAVEPVDPETPAEALTKKRSRLGLEMESARLEVSSEQRAIAEAPEPQEPHEYLPPLPPITAAQLAEPPPAGPGLFERFNSLFESPPPSNQPPALELSESDQAKLDDVVNRIQLGERINRVEHPISTGTRESVVGGVKAITSPAGLATIAAATVAPGVVLPALFVKTLTDVSEVVSKVIEHSRFGSDPSGPDYYKAVADAAQTGAVLIGTGPAAVRLPRAMDAWRESVAQRAETRFETAKNITPLPPRQIASTAEPVRAPTEPTPAPSAEPTRPIVAPEPVQPPPAPGAVPATKPPPAPLTPKEQFNLEAHKSMEAGAQRVEATIPLVQKRNRLVIEELPKHAEGTLGRARVEAQITELDRQIREIEKGPPPAPGAAPVPKPPEPVVKETLTTAPAPPAKPAPEATKPPVLLAPDKLPGYAHNAIRREGMSVATNEGGSIDALDPYKDSLWEKVTVPVDSLPPAPKMKPAPGGSVTTGPIVVDISGNVLDGNNRLYEARQRGDKTIEAFVQRTVSDEAVKKYGIKPAKPEAAPRESYGERYVREQGIEAARARVEHLRKRQSEEAGNPRTRQNLYEEEQSIQKAIFKTEAAPAPVAEATELAEFHDPISTGALLGAFQRAHGRGEVGLEAQKTAWSLYAAGKEAQGGIANLTDWLAKTKRIEELMRPKAAVATTKPLVETGISGILASTDTPQAKSAALRKLATDQGISVKDVQEQVESEIVLQAHAIVIDPSLAPLGKFTKLLDLYNRQPTLSARTSTSVELQAYSTPAPLSYALSYAAGVTPDAPVYDATAGNGMLLIGSNLKTGHGNELNPARGANLTKFGIGTVTPHDATAYTPGTTYPFVLLNPPFGSIDNVNFGGYGIKRLEHIIALRGLDALTDDGVGTVIMGARREEGPGGKGAQWVFENYVYGHYNVVANFEVAGDLYAKQGAKWPVRVIVVAGRKQLPLSGELAPTTVARLPSWSDVWKEAERIRNEIAARRSSVVPRTAQPGLPEPVASRPTTASQGGRLPAPPSRPAQPAGGAGERGGSGGRQPAPGPRPATGDPGFPANRPSDGPSNAEITPARQPDVGRHPAPPVGSGIRPGAPITPAVQEGLVGSGQRPVPRVVPRPPASVEGAEFQTPYEPRSEGKPFGTLTPKNIAEGEHTALDKLKARVGPIDEFVADRLDMEVSKLRDVMAAEQIDSEALVLDQIETGGEAVIIGHEAGIGKGRIAAGVIHYAIINDKIPIFFTKDPKLFTDMYVDLTDIGAKVKPFIFGEPGKASIVDVQGRVVHRAPSSEVQRREMQSIAENGLAGAGYNAIFATYSQVNTRNARQEFLEKLAQDNPTIVILDESHDAAGDAKSSMQAAFMSGGTIKRGSGPNQVTTTVPGLLRQAGTLHGQGGVLYMSATYAKRPENMPVYFRTALSRSAQSFSQVVDAMKRGGVALQQAVSEALSKAGQYLRVERDFTGVRFDVKEIEPADPAKLVEDVDATTDVLAEIVRFSRAIRDKVADSTAQSETAISMTDFASVVHNQISQLLLAAKADHVVAEALAAHKRGEKPVITMMNTMGSFLEHYVEDHSVKPGDRFQLRWNELLKYALERTLRQSETLPTGGTKITSIDPDEVGLGDYYRQIQRMADGIEHNFPISPIDYIIQKLAKEGVKIAELTGRSSGIEYTNFETGEGIYRRFPVANKNRVVNGFNNGDYDGMLMNASGSTGLSAHASVKFNDKKPRHMLTVQPALDINTFVQTLGRIKRTGMVSMGTNPDGSKYGARYTYLTLPLQAELRPAAMASRKMKSLNANTTAEAGGAVKIQAEDIYNRHGDLIVSEYLGANPEVQRLLGLGIEYNEDGSINVGKDVARKFTGRQALMPDADQAAAYAEILPAYRQLIEQLKSTGDYDLEIVVHDDWAGVRKSDEELAAGTDPSNIFTAGLRVQQWEVADNRHVPTGSEMLAEFKQRIGTLDKLRQDWTAFQQRADASFASREAAIVDKLASLEPGVEISDRSKYELQRMSLSDMRTRWQRTKSSIQNILDDAGTPIEITNKYGELYEGLMTDVTFPKGNNFAPSAFRFRFKVNDPAGTLYFTGSDFTGGWFINPSNRILSDFAGVRAGQRTSRYFVTGNPIQGFTATGGQGKMVRFKSAQGEVITGLLMPRNWTPQSLVNDPRLDLVSGNAVARFLRDHGEDFRVEGNGVHRLGRGQSQNDYLISVPAPRSTGGMIYLDHALRAIVGEFEKTGNRMIARFDASKVQAAADRMAAILSVRLRAVPKHSGVGDSSIARRVSDANVVANPTQGGPVSFFNRRSEAQGLGEPSTAPTVEDVRRQRLLDREGTPVPPRIDDPTPPPEEPPDVAGDLGSEADIVDAIRRQDVMPGRDFVASPEFEFRKNPISNELVIDIVEAELEYLGQVGRDSELLAALKKGLRKEQRIRITSALRAVHAGDPSLMMRLSEQEQIAAREIRAYFEDVKHVIIESKKRDLIESLPEARAAALVDILDGMDESEAFRNHRLRATGKQAVRDALRELEELEDWGIQDYVTNIERGSYRIVNDEGTTVAVAETRVSAKEKALKYARENPDVRRLTITDEFASGVEFPTKLSRGQYFRMAQRAARALGTDVAEIQRMLRAEGSPIVVIKPPSKFAGPLQKRHGVLKGEDDIFDALPAYAWSVRKKLALDPIFKKARAVLPTLPGNIRQQVEELLTDLRGRYSLEDKIVDYVLAPIGRKPFGFSRGVNVARQVQTNLKLGYRPVSALVNRLGGLQHTWVKVGTKYWVQGRRFLKTDEFKPIWARNADYVGATAQSFLEGVHPGEAKWWQPLAMFQWAEKINRPEAFAAFYKYAQGKLGLEGEAAEAFARQATRFSQFIYTTSSLPRLLRGPTGRLAGQFKPYLVKEVEFISSLRGYEIPRYLTSFMAMGGPRAVIYMLRSLPILGAIGALWMIEDWMNRKAPRLSRGAPGFAGVDITPSVAPQLPSRATDWTGPTLADLWHLWDDVLRPTMQGERRDFSDLKDWGARLAPAVSYWDKLVQSIASREGWITDREGRLVYKPTTTEKVALAAGVKPLEQSVQEVDRAYMDHVNQITRKNRERLTKQIVDAIEKGDGVTLDKLLTEAADYGIDSDSIRNAVKTRQLEPDERLRRRILKVLRPEQAERESERAP